MGITVDLEKDFVRVALAAGLCTHTTEAVHIFLPDRTTPLPRGLVCDRDLPRVQELLDISEAKWEAVV